MIKAPLDIRRGKRIQIMTVDSFWSFFWKIFTRNTTMEIGVHTIAPALVATLLLVGFTEAAVAHAMSPHPTLIYLPRPPSAMAPAAERAFDLDDEQPQGSRSAAVKAFWSNARRTGN
jgi:hypothetical protein